MIIGESNPNLGIRFLRTSRQWLRQNLFSNLFNTLLTLICGFFLYQLSSGFLAWAFTTAKWEVISANLPLFFVGRYPADQYWRIWLVIGTLLVISALTLIKRFNWIVLAWLGSIPLILWLVGGGFGLKSVGVNLWNGLLLTVLVAIAAIVLSFPLGVLLALGRRSDLPVISGLSIAYIEIIRGLPLVGILFMAQVMLPLFLPPEIKIDRVVRAIAGFVIFSSAYVAENVRGGLQAVPRGQIQAGKALGLDMPAILWLIVLPQALRAVTPAMTGQFIGLFKDTSLVSIVGLVDLLGIGRSVLAQPDFVGRYAEVYLFIGLIYWIFCYGISLISKTLE
jgi:general L-amino acid transport system permease protein